MKSYNVISLILIAFCTSCSAQNEPELRGPLREVDTIVLQDHSTAQATPEQLKLEAATGLAQFQETIASINSAQTPMQSTQQPLQHRCTHDGCNETFSLKATLKRHIHTHQKRTLFTCTQCNKPLPSRIELTRHTALHTALSSFRSLPSHTFSSSNPQTQPASEEMQSRPNNLTSSAKRHKCPKCPRSFSKRNRLIEHDLIHTNPQALTCPTCKKKFSRKDNLKRHIRHQHPQQSS